MAVDFTIRAAEESDRAGIEALLRENYKNPQSQEYLPDELIRERADEQLENTLADRGGGRLFLGIVDDRPVALAYVVADPKRGGLLVDDLYTAPAFEGNGMASALLRTCEEFGRNKGAAHIHLNVETSKDDLQNFYEKRGWAKQFFNVAGQGGEPLVTDIDPDTAAPARVPTHLLQKSL